MTGILAIIIGYLIGSISPAYILGRLLEGFLGYFVACLLFGFLATYFLEVSFLIILIGAAVAAIVEVVPIGIDDNFTVGLISASAMQLVKSI